MIGIMTIFGIIWIFNGLRYLFFTEKFLTNMKNVLQSDQFEYTKGMGKFEIGIGICFLLFDKVIPSLVGAKYSVILLMIVVMAVLFYFNKWNRSYTDRKKQSQENEILQEQCLAIEKKNETHQ